MVAERLIPIAAWALLFGTAAACQGGLSQQSASDQVFEPRQQSASDQLSEPTQFSASDCEKVERKRWPWEPDLIDRAEAEKVAFWALSIYSPETTPVEIESVVAACLTTLGSYEQVMMRGYIRSNPDLDPPTTPIWIVQVKGKSRTASPLYETFYYDYALATVNARSGEIRGQSYLFQPLLVP